MSVLLRVCSTSNNANGNKRVIQNAFPVIAWYYGDNDFIIRTIASSGAALITRSRYLIRISHDSTDSDSCVTYGTKMAFLKLHAAARLSH